MTLRTVGSVSSLFLDTPVLRKAGRRLIPVCKTTAEDGTVFFLRSREGDRSVTEEIYEDHAYRKYLPLRPGANVIDVGAHIGAFTLDASRAVGEAGRVFAIEPLSQSFKLLQMNLEANKIKNVATFHIAAGDHDGTVVLNIYKSSASASVGQRSEKEVRKEEVQIRTLDSLSEEVRWPRIDFIKINVEGHELAVLEGARQIISRYSPRVALDTHKFGPSQEAVVALLHESYSRVEVDGSMLTAWNA